MEFDSEKIIEENHIEVVKMKKDIEFIKSKISEIKETLNNHIKELNETIRRLNSRPSWFVLVMITFLSSLVVGLVVALLK